MKTLFLATYYNNHFFAKLQLASLQKFITSPWDFAIVDDASPDVRSLLGGGLSTDDIQQQAKTLDLRYIRVPQSVHASHSNGGLVPDGLPVDHPTERHRACLHYLLQNMKSLAEGYDFVVLMESDLLVRKLIDIPSYMEGHAIAGTGRKSVHLRRTRQNERHWPYAYSHEDDVIVDFFTMYLLMVDLRKVTNLEEMDAGGFAGSDTGGKTSVFLRRHPEYSPCFINISGNTNFQVDIFSKGDPSDEDAEFVHYRAGTNWDYQSTDYYLEKLNRMLKYFVPPLYDGAPLSAQKLTSRDKEHSFLPE